MNYRQLAEDNNVVDVLKSSCYFMDANAKHQARGHRVHLCVRLILATSSYAV